MSKNNIMLKEKVSVKRIAVDALLSAMFFVLSSFAVEIAGVKITFVSLATVICAMMYGPADAMIVGLAGAFMEQMLKYGLTPTTVLWILPAGIRALIIGLGKLSLKGSMSLEVILKSKKIYVYFLVCTVAGIITSLANTLVYYIDSKIFGYYSYALIFGVLGTRLFSGILTSILTAAAAIPVLAALKKANFIDK